MNWKSTGLIMVVFIHSLMTRRCDTQNANCVGGWFGSVCQYKCHCANQIDCLDDGSCPDGITCDSGWFGPACQYADVAKQDMLTSPADVHGFLTDGDDETCETFQSSMIITFSWNTSFFFSWIRLRYIPLPGKSPRFVVALTGQNSGSILTCANDRIVQMGNTSDVACDLTTPVQQIILTAIDLQALCTVHVSGGRNIALKQDALQSSNYVGDPINVVDGNTNNEFNQGSCSQTNPYDDSNPTWTLLFRSPQIVYKYVIYNRNDMIEMLRLFILRSFDFYDDEIFTYSDMEDPKLVYSVMPSSPMSVARVNITATEYTYYYYAIVLSLCEVEIYGDSDCPFGYYGRECNNTCNCAVEGEVCIVSTGGCPSGCATGYIGEDCSEVCGPTLYGKDCQMHCSQTCPDQLCHHETGYCNDCPLGKTGVYCHEDCSPGWFGANCSNRCSLNCGGDGACSVSDGVCVSGCKDGYSGLMCDTDCQLGWYGQNCSKKCSANCGGDGSCGKGNGTCSLGCLSGYTGNTCTTACTSGSFGENCASTCSVTCGGDGSCSAQSGSCLHGCKDGYTGSLCNAVCPPRYYGPSCGHECSEFCVVDNFTGPGVCHHVSGSCLLGCQDGYEGTSCSDEKNQGEVTLIGLSCGLGLAGVVIIILTVLLCLKSRNERTRKSVYDDMHGREVDEQPYETFTAIAGTGGSNRDVGNELGIQSPTHNTDGIGGLSNGVYEDTTFQNHPDFTTYMCPDESAPLPAPRKLNNNNRASVPAAVPTNGVTHTTATTARATDSIKSHTGPVYTNSETERTKYLESYS
ncbi:unnamed protein product [Lymnaea stagnalis]|uniref:EGF-like domain-containing protein n=1 Tax=Lymnaea stagnalis TaxID=6523 RepID=A0AAV2HFW6_LYMST